MSKRKNWVAEVMLILGLLMSLVGNASILEPLEHEWLVYDSEVGSFVPFLSEEHLYFHRRHLLICLPADSQSYLEIHATKNAYLFVNNNLHAHFPDSGYLFLSTYQLRLLYPSDSLTLITLHLEDVPSKVAPKAFFRYVEDTALSPRFHRYERTMLQPINEYQIKKPKKKPNMLLFMLPFGIFSFLSLGNAVKNYFLNTQSVAQYLRSFMRYRTDIRKVDLGSLLLYLLFYSASMGYAIFLLKETENAYKGFFLEYFFFAFLFLMLKIVLMYSLGYLHTSILISQVHLQETIFLSVLFGSCFLILGLLAYSYSHFLGYPFLRYSIIFLIFLQIILVVFKANRLLDIKKLYLISYFCGTEVIPTIIFVKLFIK
ncbi:MAG: DUF4271 domain-containing protein [Cytophagales bacterium]|nr:DUF4271 domain-containing protein [Cytophagales bacterium]MDW8384386.1 DUF4271 domain-containing protein [Flammeovirgaceae bacterium]